MKNKIIISIITLHLNSILVGAEIKSQSSLHHIIKTLPREINQHIAHYIMSNQWWYLKEHFISNNISGNSARLSPDGTLLAIGSFDEIRIINTKTKKEIIFPYKSMPQDIYFEPSGKTIVTQSIVGKIRAFDLQTQKEVAFIQLTDKVDSACFSPDGKLFAISPHENKNHSIKIFDIETQKQNCILNFKQLSLSSPCFSPCGKFIAIISTDYNIPNNNRSMIEIRIDLDGLIKHGPYERENSYRSTAHIIDLKTEKEIAAFSDDNDKINSIHFSPCGQFIATTSNDCKAHIFNIQTQEKITSFPHPSMIDSAHFTSDGKQLLITSCFRANIFDLQTQRKIAFFNHSGHLSQVDDIGKKFIVYSCQKVDLFERYDDYTINQVTLKNALLTWLLIEKPNKQINTFAKLLEDIAIKCEISAQKLHKIWKTFPKAMQAAIWRTMLYRIKKYGK